MISIPARTLALTLTLAACVTACGGDASSAPGGAQEPMVDVAPPFATTAPGGTVHFAALVTGAVSASVTWAVRELGGGTVTASGDYTAPAAAGTYTVVATSAADTSKSGLAVVSVEPPSSTDPTGLVPLDRVTRWSPGIPGGIPSVTAVHTTIDAAAYGNGSTDAAPAINAAIKAAGAVATSTSRQVVYLPAGTYLVRAVVALNQNNVVLRGAGPGQTRIVGAVSGGPAVRIGSRFSYGSAINVVGDVPKGSKTVTVADASSFQAGDVLQLDQQDDSYVWLFDGHYSKRQPTGDVHGPGTGGAAYSSVSSPGGPWRSMTQQIEVAGVSGNTLTLTDPIHLAFSASRNPQVFKTVALQQSANLGTRYAGLEDLAVTGGNNDNVDLINVAYCWLKRVESDGQFVSGDVTKPGVVGRAILLLHAYRCVIRDSYVHHARNIVNGGGAYGIALEDGSSANLVENNICVWLNKPIVANVSGGGNVIAYNYVDNAMINGSAWQENAIDGCHQTFSHSDLVEGNYAPNIGSDSTHGNAGFHVYFRNYATGRNGIPYNTGSATGLPTQNLRAVGMDAWSREHSFVGNVLVAANAGSGTYYQATPQSHPSGSPVYRLGDNGSGGAGGSWDDGTAATMAYRHGNWDSVTNGVLWDATATRRDLPPSFYLELKPAFFGSLAWPWVDPNGATAADRVKVLPAKARYDAGTPNG